MSVSASDSSTPELGRRPAEFPIRERGFGFDDFVVGREFEHATRRTVLASDNALFTTWSLAFNPLYLDRECARAAGNPDIVVNPLLVLGIVFGLTVEDLSEQSTAFLGIDDLRFERAVYPGDTLRASSVVTERRRSRTRPAGIVSWRTTGFNQRDEVVISFLRSNLFSLEEAR